MTTRHSNILSPLHLKSRVEVDKHDSDGCDTMTESTGLVGSAARGHEASAEMQHIMRTNSASHRQLALQKTIAMVSKARNVLSDQAVRCARRRAVAAR